MNAKVYNSDKQLICTLSDVSIANIGYEAYRIVGCSNVPVITTSQLSNVILEIIDQGKIVKTLTQGYASKIEHRATVGNTPETYVIIEV